MKDTTTKLSENLILIGTELGVNVVQQIVAQTLTVKPGISLKEFAKILDTYIDNARKALDADIDISPNNPSSE